MIFFDIAPAPAGYLSAAPDVAADVALLGFVAAPGPPLSCAPGTSNRLSSTGLSKVTYVNRAENSIGPVVISASSGSLIPPLSFQLRMRRLNGTSPCGVAAVPFCDT